MLVYHQYYQENIFHMMNILVFMFEHFLKFTYNLRLNSTGIRKREETMMIKHLFRKMINLTPGVTVA